MELKSVAKEINDLLEKRRRELELTFIEEKHVYYMKDKDGILRKNYPSVSKLIKMFHAPFDAEGMALKMSKGDPEAAKILQEQWKELGRLSANLGSRVHFELENELVNRYGSYKEVRRPLFECTSEQLVKSDNMIKAGKSFIELMEERGAVLLDTEIVLGDNDLGYTGQADKGWLIMNKEKNGFGIIISDWKTNQPKNFEIQHYTGKMYPPFNTLPDNSLGHYYIQLPLYGRLLVKMLEGTKYQDINLLGCVIVLLKEDSSFVEYKVPPGVNKGILTMDLTRYTTTKKYNYVN